MAPQLVVQGVVVRRGVEQVHPLVAPLVEPAPEPDGADLGEGELEPAGREAEGDLAVRDLEAEGGAPLDVVAVEADATAAERLQPVHDLLGRGLQRRLAENQNHGMLSKA